MTTDLEWRELATAWRAVEPDPATTIRGVVRRQSRRMRMMLAAEIGITIGAFALVAWVVARNPTRATIGWAIAATIHSALVWAFGITNRRGTWRPMAETTRAYLTLALERARRQRQAARFVLVLLAVETTLIVGWAIAVGARSGWHWLSPAAVILGGVGWSVWVLADSPGRFARLRELDRAFAERTDGWNDGS
jgi:hypothetical protein